MPVAQAWADRASIFRSSLSEFEAWRGGRRGDGAVFRSEQREFAVLHHALADPCFSSGNYAVFGRVTEDLDVVRQIRVGDKMNSVTIVGE